MISQPLPTAILGRTGLRVTRLGYGAGHRKPMDGRQTNVILNAVLDSGINLLDTTDDYGNSEELIGRYLSHRRSEFYLATKCGVSPSGRTHLWTTDNILRTLEQSLKRLKTDYVDLMQLHNATVDECQSGDLVEALQQMRQQGKVRWIGVSTNLPDLPAYVRWGVFDVFQIPYSALERDHEDLLHEVAEAGAGILIRGGVALGEPGVGKGSAQQWAKFQEAGLGELREEGESRTAFMVRFTLTHPHTNSNIVGTTDPDHLEENVQAVLRGPLSPEVYAKARRLLDAVGVKPASNT